MVNPTTGLLYFRLYRINTRRPNRRMAVVVVGQYSLFFLLTLLLLEAVRCPGQRFRSSGY